MDENFRETLFGACQRAISRTDPPGEQKTNYAWKTEGWFVWRIPLALKTGFTVTESAEFVLPSLASGELPFYKVEAYTTGIKGKKNHVRMFDFDLASEEDLARLGAPLLTLLRARKDPLYGSLATIRLDKNICALHEEVIKAVLTPVEHHEMHTDLGSGYDEAVRLDASLLRGLTEGRFVTLADVYEASHFTTVADLEPGMRVRIPKHGDKIATITAIQPYGTLGKAFTVQYVFNDSGTFGWHVMSTELSYDWTIVGPPEHHELHTDTEYEESITPEQFAALTPGTRFTYKGVLYQFIKKTFPGASSFVAALVAGNPDLRTDYPWGRTFVQTSGELGGIELLPPEHEELHGDYSAYDESAGKVTEIRKKTSYAPPRSGKGVPSLTAKRSEMDEQHREDFNSIYYEVQPWQFTVGRASLSNGVVVFKAKCFPKGTSENPYEDENAVKPLDGPPFYALTIALSVMPGRGGQSIPFHVKRYFDASGTLCWAKGAGSAGFRDIFCPMGDLHHMENRAFGNTVPSVDGYFLALASGSVSDFLGTDEVKMNLWKLFNPLVRELALRPEVRELEEPFAHVGHEELHTDIGGYDEGRRLGIKANQGGLADALRLE
jgi:hypothetical protein